MDDNDVAQRAAAFELRRDVPALAAKAGTEMDDARKFGMAPSILTFRETLLLRPLCRSFGGDFVAT